MSRIRAALIAVLVSFSVAAAAAETPLHRAFNVAPGGTLTIETDVGDVQVSPGTAGVTVDVYRRGKAERNLEVTFDQQQNDVTIRARYPNESRWFSWRNSSEARFVVTVPAKYNLQLATSGGDIKVGNIEGDVRCKTSGGSIDLGRIAGPVDGRTSGGDVSVEGARGTVDVRTSGGSIRVGDAASSVSARTSGGSIEIKHAGGDLRAHTSGGNITIEEALGAVEAETSGGSIRARLAQQPRADSRLSTSGGGITVSLASNVAVDVDAHCSGGDVDSDVPITILGRQSGTSLRGKIRGGGPRLVLRCSGGGIRLQKL